MNFSSAFELKHQVLTHVVPQSLGAMINAPGLGVRARSMTEFGGSLDKLRLGLAIGICAGKSSQDFRIAVRVQSQSLLKSPVIEAILREAHDEADIRYTALFALFLVMVACGFALGVARLRSAFR